MKLIVLTLALTLLASTAQAGLVFHQSQPNPTTNHVTSWAFYSEKVLLSQDIALANVISDDANIVTFVKNCKPKTNGGEYEQFVAGGEHAKGIWIAGGARLIDQAAYRICLHGILNNGGKI
jgi:hypothetical protein